MRKIFYYPILFSLVACSDVNTAPLNTNYVNVSPEDFMEIQNLFGTWEVVDIEKPLYEPITSSETPDWLSDSIGKTFTLTPKGTISDWFGTALQDYDLQVKYQICTPDNHDCGNFTLIEMSNGNIKKKIEMKLLDKRGKAIKFIQGSPLYGELNLLLFEDDTYTVMRGNSLVVRKIRSNLK